MHGVCFASFGPCVALCLVSCLPKDTRPPPGEIELTATNAGAFSAESPALVTDDGWTLRVDRFLISIGDGQLDDCDDYSEAMYQRVLDVRRSGPQRIALMFGLGHCALGFGLRDPGDEGVRGEGVTDADLTFMRTPHPDDYTAKVNGGLGGAVSVTIEGSATRGAATEHFAWAFRRHYDYTACALPADGGLAPGITLTTDHTEPIDIAIHGEALFLDSLALDVARPRFDAIAGADTVHGDADGDVTLHELAAVPLSDVYPNAAPSLADAGISGAAVETLEDFVYLALVTRLARIEGSGSCDVAITDEE
jgi:hypothetical protein